MSKSLFFSILVHALVLFSLFFSSDIIKQIQQSEDALFDESANKNVEVSYIEANRNPFKKIKPKQLKIKTNDKNAEETPAIPESQIEDKRSKVEKAVAKVDEPAQDVVDESTLSEDEEMKPEEVKIIRNPNPPEEVDYTVKTAKAISSANSNGSLNGTDARTLSQLPGNPLPEYPQTNRLKKQQGTVILKYLVTSDGSVNDIRIFRSSGFKNLDIEALNKVKKWRFKPGQAGETFHPIIFKLKGEGEKLRSRLRVKKQS